MSPLSQRKGQIGEQLTRCRMVGMEVAIDKDDTAPAVQYCSTLAHSMLIGRSLRAITSRLDVAVWPHTECLLSCSHGDSDISSSYTASFVEWPTLTCHIASNRCCP